MIKNFLFASLFSAVGTSGDSLQRNKKEGHRPPEGQSGQLG